MLVTSGISLLLAMLAGTMLVRLHGRRIVYRRLRLWRPAPEAQPMNLLESPAGMDLPYADDSIAPDPGRRTRLHPIQRLDRTYFREGSGNLEDPTPPHRSPPTPVSDAAQAVRFPRKSA